MTTKENYLERLYYNRKNPIGFRGIQPLIDEAQTTVDKNSVKDWASSQDTYTLFKPVRRKFRRNYYIVTNINDLWESDLVDLQKLQKENNGIKFLLTTIDVFSKKAYVEPLRDKTAHSIIQAFRRIFEESGLRPVNLRTDKGKEFIAKEVQKFFKDNNVNHYTVKNPDVKAAIIERFNRTLKTRMWRYLFHINSYKYIDALTDLVDAYNNSYHTTIKMCPNQVDETNILQVYHNTYDKKSRKKIKPKLREGDFVRLVREKGVFEKGYEYTFTEEIFKVIKVIRHPVPVYEIKDLNDEIIDGHFYEAELQKVKFDPNAEFKVDKILKSKGKGVSKKVLVSWRGYPPAFNSWILEKDLKQL
ncbi:hypothetical protein V9T40_012555 [Parthenolecanium corni]|uniref:Integrase n=1 Tax=Parthenolecanium corni TaxID=536013 RepID=A0AAN9TB04_9HEMI